MQQAKILVIDSGIGGLSVTKELTKVLTHSKIFYIADTLFFPYGILTELAITQRVEHIIRETLPFFQPDIVVIACNTASTVVLRHLRQIFTMPLVGVVPAIKPAAALSKLGHFAVLATEGTINRPYTHGLISQFASHCQVDLVPCPLLVEIAEDKLKGRRISQESLALATSILRGILPRPDTVVLACTHFPLLKNELQELYPEISHWVDSGEAIARRVDSLLGNSLIKTTAKGPNILRVTGNINEYDARLIESFLGPWELIG